MHETEMTKSKTDDTMEEQAEAKILSLHSALFHAGLQITISCLSYGLGRRSKEHGEGLLAFYRGA